MMSSEDRFPLVFRPLLLLAPLALLLTGCSGSNLFELMMQPRWGCSGTVYVVLALVALIDLLDAEGHGTANKVLWALLIIFFPFGGAILYFLFGRE